MDRTTKGLVAGFAGAVIMNTWSLLSFYALDFADRRYFDWSSILVFGRLPLSFSEIIVALLFQIVWSSFFGVIFALLVPVITSQQYILKGAIYGFLLSFIFYVFPMLFTISELLGITLGNVVTEMVGGTLWGATMAITLAYFNKSIKV